MQDRQVGLAIGLVFVAVALCFAGAFFLMQLQRLGVITVAVVLAGSGVVLGQQLLAAKRAPAAPPPGPAARRCQRLLWLAALGYGLLGLLGDAWPPLQRQALAAHTLALATVLWLAFAQAAVHLLLRDPGARWRWLGPSALLLLTVLPGSHGLLCAVNGLAAPGQVEERTIAIHDHAILQRPWGTRYRVRAHDRGAAVELVVPAAQFQPGQAHWLQLRIRPGRLGVEWLQDWRVVGAAEAVERPLQAAPR